MRARGLDPAFFDALYNGGNALLALNSADGDTRAQAWYREALALRPADTNARHNHDFASRRQHERQRQGN